MDLGEYEGLGFLVALALGGVAGSFFNVVIARLPDGRSIVRPGSACPACGRAIRFHDNVPVLSWLLLRGRCRDCRARISARYPAIEAGTMLLFGVTYLWFGFGSQLFLSWAIVSTAIVVAGIDWRTGMIYDVITYPLIGVGFACSLAGITVPLWHALLGAVLGAGILASTNLVWKEGMGWGDVKYAAGLGLFFGIGQTLFLVVAAAILGAAGGLLLISRRRKTLSDRIPFGPALAAAAVLTIFVGSRFVRWFTGE